MLSKLHKNILLSHENITAVIALTLLHPCTDLFVVCYFLGGLKWVQELGPSLL